MSEVLKDENRHATGTEVGEAAGTASRGHALVAGLVNDLAAASSGVAFIGSCLDRVLETWNLVEAWAVIDDAELGPQLFSAGRRPLDLNVMPSTIFGLGPGIHTDPPVPDDEGDLDAIANLCEIALTLDRLRYESLHDPLTGLYNRRGFDEQLAAAISRSLRYRWSFGLVVIDLDGFKSVNDRVGHQGGDRVLRQVGEQLRHGLRAGDVAARVGGDEFALLLHIDGPSSLTAILDRVHGTQGFGDAGDVTWTAGLAMCPDEAATVHDLYRVADRRLYEAKVNGDNRPSGVRMEIPR
jgi:diguanylate cyclase (GGDEF)-like protein